MSKNWEMCPSQSISFLQNKKDLYILQLFDNLEKHFSWLTPFAVRISCHVICAWLKMSLKVSKKIKETPIWCVEIFFSIWLNAALCRTDIPAFYFLSRWLEALNHFLTERNTIGSKFFQTFIRQFNPVQFNLVFYQ